MSEKQWDEFSEVDYLDDPLFTFRLTFKCDKRTLEDIIDFITRESEDQIIKMEVKERE